jgi:hypothetical protein
MLFWKLSQSLGVLQGPPGLTVEKASTANMGLQEVRSHFPGLDLPSIQKRMVLRDKNNVLLSG